MSEMLLFAANLPYQAVQEHIDRGGSAILITGSTECHGSHLPQGTDTYIAQAVALKVAQACDGLIFPPIWHTYSGGTRSFRGTISIPSEVQTAYTRAILKSLIADGYKHIIHLQWHGPYYSSQQLTREIFEETGVPVTFFGLMALPVVKGEEVTRLIGTDTHIRETTVAAGALAMLGLSDRLNLDQFDKDQTAAARPEEPVLEEIAAAGGIVGHMCTDESQHVSVRIHPDADAGERVITLMAEAVAEAVVALKKYVVHLEKRAAEKAT